MIGFNFTSFTYEHYKFDGSLGPRLGYQFLALPTVRILIG